MQVRSLGQEDPHGGGNGKPLQYSCLENSMNRGAWQATVHRVTKSHTQPKRLSAQIFSVQHFSFSRTRTCTLKVAFLFSLFTLSPTQFSSQSAQF